MNPLAPKNAVFIANIKQLIHQARHNTYRAINFVMVETNWNISKSIVEQVQQGKQRADYGKQLITQLALRSHSRVRFGLRQYELVEHEAILHHVPNSRHTV